MKTASRSFKALLLGFLIIALTFTALPAPAQARSGPPSFADLAEKLLPSVVNISTTQTINRGNMEDMMPDMQFPPGSPFEDFFKDFMQRHGQQGGQAQKHKATALGSGFIIDPSGYIVTNYHVIEDADEINVILQDDTNLSATVVGRDKKTDIALLKVSSKKPLPAVSFGDSDKIRVGDWILAIGNPYGLGGTVTAGIISARSRNINAGPYDEFLQTDASINRGNSGGPMFDTDGNVVGINTAIFSPSGGSIGIGFAIPSSLAKNIVEQLKNNGHIRRGWLGVNIQTVTKDIADGLGMDQPKGALVSNTSTDGPAAKAGIQPGDVIVTFDGKEVPDMHRLPLMVAGTEVDKTVDVVVIRKGSPVTLKVKVGEMKAKDSDEEVAAKPEKDKAAPAADKVEELGLSVAPASDALRRRFELKKSAKGLVVTAVAPTGIAADYGLQPGDVIAEAAQKDVKSAKELSDIAAAAKKDGKPLLLLVNRHEDMMFVAVNFGKKK